jgi:uncharacterized protein (DUF2252 family)
MGRDVVKRIRAFNRGRDPELLPLKYARMRTDVFAFFRGTCHLFHQDWPKRSPLDEAPVAWVCGDLHLENVGTYRGRNGLAYFDLNDFDEAALAPLTRDLARVVASVFVAAEPLRIDRRTARGLARHLLDRYAAALGETWIGWVERETARGTVRDLLDGLRGRSRAEFLDRRTHRRGDQRAFTIDGEHLLPISEEERGRVTRALGRWAQGQEDPRPYRLLDTARRVAGTGSVGVARYALLVEGDGSPDGNRLLELKAEGPSSLAPSLSVRQPRWRHEAERVCAAQRAMQAAPPALLAALEFEGKSYLLHEVQPLEDRFAVDPEHSDPARLRDLVGTIGEVVAWDQLRGAGRSGADTADRLIAFAGSRGWRSRLLDYGERYRAQVQKDYAAFCEAWDGGELGPRPKRGEGGLLG